MKKLLNNIAGFVFITVIVALLVFFFTPFFLRVTFFVPMVTLSIVAGLLVSGTVYYFKLKSSIKKHKDNKRVGLKGLKKKK